VVFVVIIVGTFGYWWLWQDIGGTVIDALYMTWITIATIGYTEVHPLDDTGHIFTIIMAHINFLGTKHITFQS